MKEIAAVICNYNKKNYLLNCIDSLLKSSYKDYDIYIVDNASTDGSVEAVKEKYEAIKVLENKENLGGSGGFNTGIRETLKKDYKYILLLDNDVILNKDAVVELHNLLEKDSNIAAAGAKIYSMDNPKELQELGAEIDFSQFDIKPFYKGYTDDETLPEIIQCDFVPACCMLTKVEAIKKVGIMDEENFIYWDDIDWGYRFKQAGYKVAAYSKSMVLHKMGVVQKKNTLGTYYFWRNRVKFFRKYCTGEQLEKFSEKLFDDMLKAIYSCVYSGKYNSAKTILFAVSDALNNTYGKAKDNRIMELESIEDKFSNLIMGKKHILIIHDSELSILRNIINRIRVIDKHICITVAADNLDDITEQFDNVNLLELRNLNNHEGWDLTCKTCSHIFDVRNEIEHKIVYVDRYFNIIADEEDAEYVRNYDRVQGIFKNLFYSVILNKIND